MSPLSVLSPASLAALVALALIPRSADAASLALSPDTVVVESTAAEVNSLRGSLSLSSASLDTGEIVFRLDAEILGPSQYPTLIGAVEVVLDFGSALVDLDYSLQFLSGGWGLVIYSYPCGAEPRCNQIHFSVTDPSITLVSVFADPASLPSQVRLTLGGYTKFEPLTPLIASGSGLLIVTPEPPRAFSVAVALGLLAACRFRRSRCLSVH